MPAPKINDNLDTFNLNSILDEAEAIIGASWDDEDLHLAAIDEDALDAMATDGALGAIAA